ncbi:zinc metalloprotease HtpX [Kocuria sp. cx-455]|uniref:zinc metalloprotease HtpX n=1 Tax=unclassified Candidatus Sulfotelmatobacter TaxID=2635724 RepID=UPI0016826A55|nr:MULTISPECIES: zinc metalloprotease HtpX [unclassified Candidatus Sulfotelmatobacter]MBD2762295.1 zinc metalloprotease HtpX [Kocuria sp. cx-116]MBD2764263.1 zinc metalloprotease HtpX [Kocuria sp. cx-455]
MHKHYNGLKTVLLLGGMWAVLLVIGAVIAGATRSSVFIVIFAVVGLIGTAYSYWNSDKLAIRSMRAIQVTPQQAPSMYRIVHELSQRAGQPMPRLYIAPTMSPNAFATGRNPENAAVCCTEGILQILDERELRGVLGHELMHVYNRDILTSSVAAAVAGLITSAAQFLQFAAIFGGRGGDRGGNPLVTLLMAFLAPVAAMVIQMAISRTREYDADQDGSQLTGDPLALASALRKIEGGASQRPMNPDDQKLVNTSHLMIANPFRGGGLKSMFRTHPSTDDRVARLENMARSGGFYGRTN